MSLLRALPRTTAPLCRARFFSNSPLVSRSVFEGTKDAIKAGHDAASQTLVKGIEVGESAAEAVKSTVGVNASEAKGSASEMAGKAKGKAQEVSGSAQGTGSELAGEAKGKAQEVFGSAQGTGSELAGEAKGKASELSGKAKGKVEDVKSKM